MAVPPASDDVLRHNSTPVVTRPVRGPNAGNLQGTITKGGTLSGSPRLTFAQDASGDTVTRSEGSWDTGDGFAIGQRITITGALNAGIYTITNITNGGKTLVLDIQEIVNEVVTSALSIFGSVYTPPELSPIDSDDSADAGRKNAGALTKELSINSDDGPDASRHAANAPGRAIRSATEITEILQALCDEELALTAYPEQGELLFVSTVRAVDPDFGRIVVDYSQWKPANSALLDCKSVLFHCERKKRHIQFLTGAPTEIVFGGAAGLQIGFPQFVLDLQRRTHRRFRIKSLPSLWCVINQEGTDPIVANVSDISRGGFGAFIPHSGVVLKPGTIFKNCQITGASLRRPIDVSIEVRHWKMLRAQDGTLNKRVGCRFVASVSNLQELIDVFEAEFDEDGGED